MSESPVVSFRPTEFENRLLDILCHDWRVPKRSEAVRRAVLVWAFHLPLEALFKVEDLTVRLGMDFGEVVEHIRLLTVREWATNRRISDSLIQEMESLAGDLQGQRRARLRCESTVFLCVLDGEWVRVAKDGPKQHFLTPALFAELTEKHRKNLEEMSRPDFEQRQQADIDRVVAEGAKYAAEHPEEQAKGRAALMAKHEEHVKKAKR